MMFRAGNAWYRILILSCYLIVETWPVSIKLVAPCGHAMAEWVLRPSLGGVSCLKLRLSCLEPWLVPRPLSRAEYRTLQGRGFIIFCVSLAH
jgi:hypothetical protein